MAERGDPQDDNTEDEEVHGSHFEQRNEVKIVVNRCANCKKYEYYSEETGRDASKLYHVRLQPSSTGGCRAGTPGHVFFLVALVWLEVQAPGVIIIANAFEFASDGQWFGVFRLIGRSADCASGLAAGFEP
jgi:hypothetical protein